MEGVEWRLFTWVKSKTGIQGAQQVSTVQEAHVGQGMTCPLFLHAPQANDRKNEHVTIYTGKGLVVPEAFPSLCWPQVQGTEAKQHRREGQRKIGQVSSSC